MPKGRIKKPLKDLSIRQFQRRVKTSAALILTTGTSLLSSRISPTDLSSGPSKPTAKQCFGDPVDQTEDVLYEDLEPSKEVEDVLAPTIPGNSYVDYQPGSSRDFSQTQCCCYSCLVCFCIDCTECKVERQQCSHCDKCLKGTNFDSDLNPLSSDEERESMSDEESVQTLSDPKIDLSLWATEHGVTQSAIKDLLDILRSNYDASLPRDPRQLLGTPRSIKTRSCPPGTYWHCGIKVGLESLDLGVLPSSDNILILNFNIDGLPLSRSSKSCFWPILCSVKKRSEVFLVGAYHGYDKPDANEFLCDFVAELKELCKNGVVLEAMQFCVHIGVFILDAPAKSFLFHMKGHNAYFSCSKCIGEGEYVMNRVTFPDCDAPLRTDEGFRNKVQKQHHTGDSILTNLDFDTINQVVLDYMHLIPLGVVRKMLNTWKEGRIPYRLPSSIILKISDVLESLKSFIPREFVRRPQSLLLLRFFKATECDQLLVYTGPVAFQVLMREGQLERYKHFLVFHVAVTILRSPRLLRHYGTSYPNELLKSFVKSFACLYGKEQISHNVHNLVHIARDVEAHGNLDQFSAFRFENFLQRIKRLIRKGDRPLQQLANRMVEVQSLQKKISPRCVKDKPLLSGRHSHGPLIEDCEDPQYNTLTMQDFTLNLTTANRCCGVQGDIVVEIVNIAYCRRRKCTVIIGRYYRKKSDLYEFPLMSSHLGIYMVENESELTSWPVSKILCKYVRLPVDGQLAVFPLLHTEN